MLEDILSVEFNTLGELRVKHAAPVAGRERCAPPSGARWPVASQYAHCRGITSLTP
jgi:hypothetical protein